MKRWILPFVLLTLIATPASADDVTAHSGPELGLGARIGGYGFRQVDEGALSWEACRMNGVGIYGTVDVAKYFFGELAADFYHSIGNSWDMDRVSFFPSAAIGARMMPGKLVSPYIQVGGGPEITRIELAGITENKILPTAFMGVGGELNIKSFHFGTVLKVFTMGLPEYEEPTKTPESFYYPNNLQPPPDELTMRQEVAAQMQFFARYTF